jgi:hypothetical protein
LEDLLDALMDLLNSMGFMEDSVKVMEVSIKNMEDAVVEMEDSVWKARPDYTVFPLGLYLIYILQKVVIAEGVYVRMKVGLLRFV